MNSDAADKLSTNWSALEKYLQSQEDHPMREVWIQCDSLTLGWGRHEGDWRILYDNEEKIIAVCSASIAIKVRLADSAAALVKEFWVQTNATAKALKDANQTMAKLFFKLGKGKISDA